jgi:hypothetical protein
MDRLIRFLDVAHRIWGAMALVVFGLLAIDAYGYFTHQPGSPTHAVFAKGWQFIGETTGYVQHMDDVTPSATYKGTRNSSGNSSSGSTDAAEPSERAASGGRAARDGDSSYATIASTGGGEYSEETNSSNSDSWSCPRESRSTHQQRPVAQFPSLATLTDTRQRRSAIRELEARLRCDYQAEREGNADAAAAGSFEEWRQATLQRRYGPEWNRIALSDLPTP